MQISVEQCLHNTAIGSLWIMSLKLQIGDISKNILQILSISCPCQRFLLLQSREIKPFLLLKLSQRPAKQNSNITLMTFLLKETFLQTLHNEQWIHSCITSVHLHLVFQNSFISTLKITCKRRKLRKQRCYQQQFAHLQGLVG